MKIPFSRFIVYGNSMFPTLKPGQNILCFRWSYILSKPKIGDLVVIRYNNLEIVKRIQKVTQSVIPAKAGIQLKVFVKGDNQEESTDSRSFGLVDRPQLVGKVIYTGT